MHTEIDALDFVWDERKRIATLTKHGVDFRDAIRIFENPVLTLPSHQREESRWMAIGHLGGIVLTLVYVIRGDCYRIITARRAHKDERRKYYAHVAGGGDPPQG